MGGALMQAARLIILPGVLTRVSWTGDPDDYNTPTEETETAQVQCWYEQLSAEEQTGSEHQQSETHRVFFPPDTDPTGWDRLAVNGLNLEMVGPPWQPINPRTRRPSHWVAKARQVV